MIIARGALLSLLAVVGAQPLSAKVEVSGDTAKQGNIVETAVGRVSSRPWQLRWRRLD